MRKCVKCGFELTDASAAVCPMCGSSISGITPGTAMSGAAFASPRRPTIWVGALVQFAFMTTFILVFKFPKFMIVIFGGLIVVGTALSARAKQRALAPRAPQRPLSHPTLFKILSSGIALCSLALFSTLLFGFVIFMNNWNDWHRYEGQPYHVTTFEVTRVYYQKQSKSVDLYASGMADGQREWMSLQPYLHTRPRNQAELEELVATGTSIPIYLFPELKGRLRVRVYNNTPPAEGYHRSAINAVNYGLTGLAICAALLFILIGLRRMCFAETDSPIQLAASQGG